MVGGGVSGLAAAYHLRRAGVEVSLHEAGPRLGGVIATQRRHGWLMEGGPDAFLDKGVMLPLCDELGLTDQLIQVRPEAQRSFIVRGRRLLPIPEGLYLMAPSAIGPFLRSPVVSPLGKLRMGLDLVLPPRRSSDDESLASFVRRRLGREALERLAQPLLGGIYGADPERLSLAATMPQFLKMEQERDSVIRSLLAARRPPTSGSEAGSPGWLPGRGAIRELLALLRGGDARSARGATGTSGARYGLFYTFRNGLQTLVDSLASRLPEPQLGAPLQRLADLDADAVCLCVPLPEVARLVPELPVPPVTYSSVATVNLAFGSAVSLPEGAGFVVPQVEGRTIMAATFASQKFDGRAPQGGALVRAFAGGVLGASALALDDNALVRAVLDDLAELLGIHREPDDVWLSRLPDSMPQYDVGHLQAIASLEAALAGYPKLALAGNGYRGVGVPDCISSGFAAAERLLAALG